MITSNLHIQKLYRQLTDTLSRNLKIMPLFLFTMIVIFSVLLLPNKCIAQNNLFKTNSKQGTDKTGPLYVRVDLNDLKPGSLSNQCGGEGFAAMNAWSVNGNIIVREGDLEPIAPDGSFFIRSQNGKPRSVVGSSGNEIRANRQLAKSMSGTIWFRFLVRPHSGVGTAGIQLLQAGDREQTVEIVASGHDLVVNCSGMPGAERRVGVFTEAETSVVLGRLNINTHTNKVDSISVWVNPDVLNPGKPLLAIKNTDVFNQGITHLALVISGKNVGNTGHELDEVILSNYPDKVGFFHVAPRKRFVGPWHLRTEADKNVTSLPPHNYKLVFSDEFDGNALDTSKWDYRLKDKEFSAQQPENVEVAGGNMVIHAKKECAGTYNYTGGGIYSKQTFVYGYYEARLKIPAAEGWHTAFWTMPVYDEVLKNSELDFCEQDSGDPHYYSIGVINHRAKGWSNINVGRWVIEDGPNMAEEFVVIAAEFTPDYIQFYLNGHPVKKVDANTFPHGPGTVALSCIATRKKGDRFQDDAKLPSKATFDYVRVYQNPRYAQAEAAANIQATIPSRSIPPIKERMRIKSTEGTLD